MANGPEADAGRSSEGSADSAQHHSESLFSDVMSGIESAVRSHIDGAKQAFGAQVDLSYLEHENTAQRAGNMIGDAALFVGGALLMKKVPVIGEFAEGKLASVATGGVLGFTSPLGEGQSYMTRFANTGLGAGTMAIAEFAPGQIGKIPGIKALPEQSVLSGVARYGLGNGLAGFANAEGQSYISTGHAASAQDALIGTGAWMVLGTATHQAETFFEMRAARAAEAKAALKPEALGWQFKDVKDINAADLKPGEMLSPGNYRVSFQSEGVGRKASLYVSEGAVHSAEKAPVVATLHGLNPNGQAEAILPELNYFHMADKDGAVVAMLHGRDGLKGLGTFQSFHDTNFGFAKPGANVAPYSDQISFGDMMSFVRDHVPNANTDNIAVSGFSLGGKMANRIAATRPDVGVVSSIHGTMDKFDEEVMNAAMHKHPVDGIFVLGDKDRVLPLNGGKSIFTLGLENNHLSRPLRQAEFWGTSNGSPLASVTDAPNFTQRTWTAPDGQNVVKEFVVRDGAHAIDGAPAQRNFIQWLMGIPKPPTYFDARQMSWDFMINSLKNQSIHHSAYVSPSKTA